MESLAQLEVLCERLYNSQDTAEIAQAESTLKCFSVNVDYIPQCQYILDHALTPYALMLASSSLLKQVTAHSLSLQLRLDIRNYLVNYLATRGPELEAFVIGSLIQLLCLITKYGWFEDDTFKDVVKESISFLSQATSDHYAIGLQILNQLVCEMNLANPGLPSANHRRVAFSFRDQLLFQIFQISITSLNQLKNDSNASSRLQELALSLSLKCLSFDFVGTSVDESSEEFGIVQIPGPWKPVLEEFSTVQIFFDYYSVSEPPISKEALECLVRLASVRRSLFTNDATRSSYLAHLMTGTKEILRTGKGLADHDNYHEFCRLLGRFRVNYQLAELVKMEGYSEWIRLVAEFTTKSLLSWQWASTSVYYLLGLWSRLVSAVPYLKGDAPSLLDEFVPKITEGFIISRLDATQAGQPDDLSDHPLDNVELLQDQLDSFSHLCRFQCESSSLFIINVMEPILQVYEEKGQTRTGDSGEIAIIEVKLAWIVHIIAAILRTRQSTSVGSDSQELIDAELSARVLRLVDITDSSSHSQRYAEVSKQRLDRAILMFFQHFRKSYVGDQAMHSSKLTKAYFAFLEVLFNSHIAFIRNLDSKTFMHIVGSLESGLKGLDAGISSQCASAIDNLASFYFKAPSTQAAITLERHVAEYPSLLPEISRVRQEHYKKEDLLSKQTEELKRIRLQAKNDLNKKTALLKNRHEEQLSSVRSDHEDETKRMQEKFDIEKCKEWRGSFSALMHGGSGGLPRPIGLPRPVHGTTCFGAIFGPYIVLATDGLSVFVDGDAIASDKENKHRMIIPGRISGVVAGINRSADYVSGLLEDFGKLNPHISVHGIATKAANMMNYLDSSNFEVEHSFIIGGRDVSGKSLDLWIVERKNVDTKFQARKAPKNVAVIGSGKQFPEAYLKRESEDRNFLKNHEHAVTSIEYFERVKDYAFQVILSAVRAGQALSDSGGRISVAINAKKDFPLPVQYQSRDPEFSSDKNSSYENWEDHTFEPESYAIHIPRNKLYMDVLRA